MMNRGTPASTVSDPAGNMRESARIIVYGLMGFLYLAFISGVLLILFGPKDRVDNGTINLMVVGPILTIVGYLTGSLARNDRTEPTAASVGSAGTLNVGMPPPTPSAPSDPPAVEPPAEQEPGQPGA